MRILLWKHTWSLRLGTFQRPAGWRWSWPLGVSPHRTAESPERRKPEIIEYDNTQKNNNFRLHHRLLASAVHSATDCPGKIDILLIHQWTRCSDFFFLLLFWFDWKRKHESCEVEEEGDIKSGELTEQQQCWRPSQCPWHRHHHQMKWPRPKIDFTGWIVTFSSRRINVNWRSVCMYRFNWQHVSRGTLWPLPACKSAGSRWSRSFPRDNRSRTCSSTWRRRKAPINLLGSRQCNGKCLECRSAAGVMRWGWNPSN